MKSRMIVDSKLTLSHRAESNCHGPPNMVATDIRGDICNYAKDTESRHTKQVKINIFSMAHLTMDAVPNFVIFVLLFSICK